MPDTSGVALNTQAAIALKGFFESQFGSPNFSDVTLKISERAHSAEAPMIPAHRIVLARSPKLRGLMYSDSDIVTIELDAKYLDTNTFIHVLRYLYGAALPTRNSLAGQPMDQCLSLAATGWHCALPEVTMRGIEYACTYLSWENVEKALDFALAGGLTPYFTLDEGEDVPEPSFGEFAGQFLLFILDWLVGNLPSNFEFVASAPQLADSPRLPGTLESRPSMADPRLSRIKFGDLPSEESSLPTMLLSSIMVSLPLGALQHFLLHPAFWGRPRHADMARAIIQERESRRKKALESKRHLPGATPYMREAMYWQEIFFVVDGHAQGFGLRRERLKHAAGVLGENGERGSSDEL